MIELTVNIKGQTEEDVVDLLLSLAIQIKAGGRSGSGAFVQGTYSYSLVVTDTEPTLQPEQVDTAEYCDYNRKPLTREEIETAYQQGLARLVYKTDTTTQQQSVSLALDLPRTIGRVTTSQPYVDCWVGAPNSLEECLLVAKGEYYAKTNRDDHR